MDGAHGATNAVGNRSEQFPDNSRADNRPKAGGRRAGATQAATLQVPPPIEDHNSFYRHESWRKTPKEYYKFVAEQAEADLQAASNVLDVGCANGDFLYYLSRKFPALQLTGCDVSPDLLAVAKKAVPRAQFVFGDIAGDVSKVPHHQIAFMLGVHYLLPDPQKWIKTLMHLAPIVYVFGRFNPDPLDIRAKVSRPGAKGTTLWNLISLQTIGNVAQALGLKHSFTPWTLPFALPRRAGADPLRSWTIETADGKHLIVDGTQGIRHHLVLRLAS
jgi:SAM-dependent methyltransferase